jgi:hypothetical protein
MLSSSAVAVRCVALNVSDGTVPNVSLGGVGGGLKVMMNWGTTVGSGPS